MLKTNAAVPFIPLVPLVVVVVLWVANKKKK